MKKHPLWYLVIGFVLLIVPSVVYMCFLLPQLKEEYNILLASGGVLGGFGYYGASKIPESVKYSGLFKTASRAYTTLIFGTLIQDFLPQIIWLLVIAVTSIILFVVFKELYKNAKRRLENKELASEISRSLTKDTQ